MIEVVNETGIQANVVALTSIENIPYTIREEIKNKRNDNSITTINLLKNIKDSLKESKAKIGDYSQLEDTIKIFLSEIKSISPTKYLYLWELLTTPYHEYNHKLFWEKAQIEKNLENFSLLIEELTAEITDIYTTEHHDNFYDEIIANVYSVKKSSQFLKKYPNIYKILRGYIEYDRLKYQLDLINYDVEQFLNYLNKQIKKYPNKQTLFQNIYPYILVKILYTQEGNYKDISSLSKDNEWITLEKEVQYTVIASKSYLSELNYNTLSKEELIFVLDSLMYSYQKEQIRNQQINDLKKEIQKFNKMIFPKLKYGDNLIDISNKRETRNKLKIKYLKQQIDTITKLIQEKTIVKKNIRTHKA